MIAESKLLEKIKSGERIERLDDMTPEYKQHLENLMMMQADSELAGAVGYMPWIEQAPSIEEKLAVASMVRDEVGHAHIMYGLLKQIGVDVQTHVEKNNFGTRVNGQELGTNRAADDKRVNIFYYPIDTWADYVMFNFMMDRGAGHQLEDALHCSFGPWCRATERIFKEEVMHIRHGEYWVERLAKGTSAEKAEVQAAVDLWFPRVMNIFGRKGSTRNKEYQKFGLKQRDNDAVRETFAKEVHTLLDRYGLSTPKWP